MSDNFFSADNAVSVNWGKWDEIGKSYKGVYVEHREEPSDLSATGKQHVYVLVQDDGSAIWIPAPGARELKPMQTIPLGAVVGFKFEKELEPQKKGYNKTKQIGVYWPGRKVDMEALKRYQGVGFSEEDRLPEEDDLPPV